MKRFLILGLIVIFIAGCSNNGVSGDISEVSDVDLKTSIETELESAGLLDGPGAIDIDAVLADLDENLAEQEKIDRLMKIARANKCLVGDWKLTNFSEYLTTVMDSSGAGNIPVVASDSGDLIISFDGQNMTMSENNFIVNATAFGIGVEVDVDATGTALYSADEFAINNLSVSGNVATETDSPIDGEKLTSSFDINSMGSTVLYQCNGDSLIWEKGGAFPVDLEFIRL